MESTGPIVVKVGGGADIAFDALYDDLAALMRSGTPWVLVHGGNALLTELQERVGTPPRFVTDGRGKVSRYTDAETMELFAMAYAGALNTRHVAALRARGIDAIGLSGVDGGLLVGTRQPTIRVVEEGKKKVLRDDHVGTLHTVNGDLLRLLLGNGYAPVVTLPAYADGPEGAGGVPINIDGDTAAFRIAEALGARALVYLSDVPGLLRDPEDRGSLIQEIAGEAGWQEALTVGKGRMRRKVEGARDAVAAGIPLVVFRDASAPEPVSSAIRGEGTHFRGPVPVREATA